MKHTEGNWQVDGFNTTAVIAATNEDSNHTSYQHVCTCDYGYAKPEEFLELNKANAKLISAAPDLLEALIACKTLLEVLEVKEWTDQEKVDNAIKKATA